MAGQIVKPPPAQTLLPLPVRSANIRGISDTSWFGPLEPLLPMAPAGTQPRQFEYQPGQNLLWLPRGQDSIGFDDLIFMADNCDLVRIVIEALKDQVVMLPWQVRVKAQPNETQKERGERQKNNPKINAWTEFLSWPNPDQAWGEWLRMLLEDLFVLDAPSILLQRTRASKIGALRVIDGQTITRLIDENGFTPLPPNPAYQQVLFGMPAVDLTTNDLVYRPRNQRARKMYGYSPVEQTLTTLNIAIRRMRFQLNYYTEGNLPEGLYTMPASVTEDNVRKFQSWFDQELTGNLAARRRIRFIPGDDKGVNRLHWTKEALLKDESDEWLARIICFSFRISPKEFIRIMARATAEESQDTSEEMGVRSVCQWIVNTINYIIQRKAGDTDIEFAFAQKREADILKQAETDKIYIDGGTKTRNESREGLGLDPSPDPMANVLGITTGTGFVPLDQIEQTNALAAAHAAVHGAAVNAGEPGEGKPGKEEPGGKGEGGPKNKPTSNETVPESNSNETQKLAKYSCGSTQANIDVASDAGAAIAELRTRIAEEHLAAGGLETEPHVTLRYGILDGNCQGIRRYLMDQPPFTLTFGQTGAFPPSENSEGAAPLFLEIDSPALTRMNEEITRHGNFKQSDFSGYTPHLTLAYVLADQVALYTGLRDLEGATYRVSAITISHANGTTESVPLLGAQKTVRKAAPALRIDTGDAVISKTDIAHLEATVAGFLRTAGDRLAAQILAPGRATKAKENDPRQRTLEEILGLVEEIDWTELVAPVESSLFHASSTGATIGIGQLGISNVGLISAASDTARDFAHERAAELVGKRFTKKGKLIDNPNAKWRIDTTTRNEIRTLVEKAFSEETRVEDLAESIRQAGAFSEARALMIARTEISRAQSLGTLNVWKTLGTVRTIRWDTSADHEDMDECDLNRDAGPIPIGSAFPSGAISPPAHPNCRCSITAVDLNE